MTVILRIKLSRRAGIVLSACAASLLGVGSALGQVGPQQQPQQQPQYGGQQYPQQQYPQQQQPQQQPYGQQGQPYGQQPPPANSGASGQPYQGGQQNPGSQQYPGGQYPNPNAQPAPGGQQFAPAPQAPPQPPFTLSPEQQRDVNAMLDLWQTNSDRVKSFECTFKHWVYDSTFLPAQPGKDQIAIKVATGELKYAAPDKGLIHETDTYIYNQSTRQYDSKKDGDHWSCDGKTIFKVDHQRKTVEATPLPPELRGQSITEGPLPFAFGGNAVKLRARYWLRLITPQTQADTEVWLEILPKFRKDAANFTKVQVILRKKEMSPKAIQIFVTQNDKEVYSFEEHSIIRQVGDMLNPFSQDTFTPSPAGYKHIINAGGAQPMPGAGGQAPAAPGAGGQPDGSQARRPAPIYGR